MMGNIMLSASQGMVAMLHCRWITGQSMNTSQQVQDSSNTINIDSDILHAAHPQTSCTSLNLTHGATRLYCNVRKCRVELLWLPRRATTQFLYSHFRALTGHLVCSGTLSSDGCCPLGHGRWWWRCWNQQLITFGLFAFNWLGRLH